MAVTAHRHDKKSYETKPESKLSQHKYIVKPETREMGTKAASPEHAERILKGAYK